MARTLIAEHSPYNDDNAQRFNLTPEQAVFSRQDPRKCPTCDTMTMRSVKANGDTTTYACLVCWHKEEVRINLTIINLEKRDAREERQRNESRR